MKDFNEIVKAFLDADKRYILLSAKSMEDGTGIGFPLVAQTEGDLFITLFYDPVVAMKYVEDYQYGVKDVPIPVAQLPNDNTEFATLLMSCMNSGVNRVAIVDSVDGGVSADIFNLIQHLKCQLNYDMVRFTIPALEADQSIAMA